ncbi:MAG: hypothetical protein JWN40_5690 [Phycisphaerales bacterium]|nr:hypothetical protein [Phycisphaerales bacterium]
MADTGTMPQVDVSSITDPDIRRALRAVVQLNQHLTAQVHQHQQEIESLLQMMVEKHIGSVGEFKRHMLKMQSADPRSERLHGQIASGHTTHTTHTAPAAAPSSSAAPAARPERTHQPVVRPDDDHPRRYAL